MTYTHDEIRGTLEGKYTNDIHSVYAMLTQLLGEVEEHYDARQKAEGRAGYIQSQNEELRAAEARLEPEIAKLAMQHGTAIGRIAELEAEVEDYAQRLSHHVVRTDQRVLDAQARIAELEAALREVWTVLSEDDCAEDAPCRFCGAEGLLHGPACRLVLAKEKARAVLEGDGN